MRHRCMTLKLKMHFCKVLSMHAQKEKASSKYQADIEKRNQEESRKQLAEEALQKQEAELNLHKV